MPVDLNIKVTRLISDFRAVLALTEFIEHELEKRIIARLGLIKIEALIAIAGTYKNEIRRNLGVRGRTAVTNLETLVTRLRTDVDTGIGNIRNAMAGHLLQLNITEIPSHWLFMGHSTYTILAQDLDQIDLEFRQLDGAYPGAITPPPPDPAFLVGWRLPNVLGPPDALRVVTMQTGLWTPDVIAQVPGGGTFQDASRRVLGLRLSIRQLGFILQPFWCLGGPVSAYERLLIELSIVDFFALEEAIYSGNVRGGTPSLIHEWASATPPHAGAAYLTQFRGSLSALITGWRDNVRNKICAHMDPDIAAADLEVDRWPMNVPDFNAEVERLCRLLGAGARLDPRTRIFLAPALTVGNPGVPQPGGIPRWSET